MITPAIKHTLQHSRSLLAFSFGIDSSALFFILIEHDIPFDIALVNYGTREQSDMEEARAKKLAQQYGRNCYTIHAPKFNSNFEKQARDFRYAFFEEIIRKHSYDNLLTAHQLDDQLEWFLMRLTRGAGLNELIGMEPIQKRPYYTLIRPLLAYSKSELLVYLNTHQHPYFVDESNADMRHERNRFRKQLSEPLLKEFKEGIVRSFEYLRRDNKVLRDRYETIYRHKELRILRLHHPEAKALACDQTLKELGYLMSADSRKEIQNHTSVVIGRKWAVENCDDLIYIAPYRSATVPKQIREDYRLNNIPPKIRPYCYLNRIYFPIKEKL
jgi:tRNA(Ile)-lysidine synthase